MIRSSSRSSSPRVSVILPAYNAARYLRAAVESVLHQTFTAFELIAVDDGSTDDTKLILKRFAARDPRVKLISRPNTGYVRALQDAIKVARGEYLARIDADDVAHPDRLTKQVQFLDANPTVSVVGSSYELIDDRGRYLRTQEQPTDDAALQQLCLAGTTPICHPTALIRRRDYDAVGGYDSACCPAEDLDLWLRLGEVGRLACLPDVLLKYRLHASSVSETRQREQMDAVVRICEAAAARRGTTCSIRAGGWRETGSTGLLRQTLKYGWWAFHSQQRGTAVAYGTRAVRQMPTSADAWKLLICGVAKAFPKPALAA